MAAVCCALIFHNMIVPKELPFWDEANHMMFGLEITQDIRNFSPEELLSDSYKQFYWGFLHSWMLAAFFILLGVTELAARLTSLFCFFLLIIAVYFAGKEISKGKSWYGGLMAALLVCSSPFLFVSASECMIEIPAMLLTVIAFYFFFMVLKNQTDGYRLLAGVLITLTFFMKTNYGTLCAVVAAVYGLTELILREETAGKIFRNYAVMFLPFVFSMFFWLLFPTNRFDEFFKSISSRVLGPSGFTVQGLIYYPVGVYRTSGLLTWLYLAAFLSSIAELKENKIARFMFLYVAVTVIMYTFHCTKCYRFIYNIFPAIYLITACQIEKRTGHNRIIKAFVLASLSVIFIFQLKSSVGSRLASNTWERERRDAFGCILKSIENPGKIFLLGEFNEMSPCLFNWGISRAFGRKISVYESGILKYRLEGIDSGVSQEGEGVNRKEFPRVISEIDADYIICLLPDKNSPFYNDDYLMWNHWKSKYVPLLRNMPGYALGAGRYYPEIGLDVSIYRKARRN